MAAIRETATDVLRQLYEFYGDEFAEDTLFPTVSDLLHHEKYLLRVTGVHVLVVGESMRGERQTVGQKMGKEMVSTRVLGQLEEVQSDPIANVRLNIAKALGQLRDQFTEDAKVKRVVPLLERYSKDPDRDVSFFAKAALGEMQ